MSKFVSNIITAVMNNLKININDVHIRYEDISTAQAMGVTIKSLALSSVDA